MKPGWNLGLFGQAAAVVTAILDKRTPWPAKALAGFVLLYLLSPFDFMPDIVPLAGVVDDALIVPAGLWFASRLAPKHVMEDARQRFAKKRKPAPFKGK